MGTCFPSMLLGKDGHLARKQGSITKLSLVLKSECQYERGPALSEFPNIKELCWKGFGCQGAFDELHNFLSAHRNTIESLELDTVSWAMVLDLLDYNDITTHEPISFFFPPTEYNSRSASKLRRLSLTAGSLDFDGDFNTPYELDTIENLRLNNCLQTVQLLSSWAKLGKIAAARTVELSLFHQDSSNSESLKIQEYFEPFQHTKDLFVMFEWKFQPAIIKVILDFKPRLHRLMYHKRGRCEPVNLPHGGGYYALSL